MTRVVEMSDWNKHDLGPSLGTPSLSGGPVFMPVPPPLDVLLVVAIAPHDSSEKCWHSRSGRGANDNSEIAICRSASP